MPGNGPVLFGKEPTEKAQVTGTSPSAYFTRTEGGLPASLPLSMVRAKHDAPHRAPCFSTGGAISSGARMGF